MANNSERAIAIGNKISRFRTEVLDNMSQNDFCKQVEEETGYKISRSTLSLIENGSQEPNLDMLVALAKVMRMDLTELVEVRMKKEIVVDTNIILNCPQMIKTLLTVCDFVYVPQVVVDELNYQKDHGSEQRKRLASLCMNNLGEIKKSEVNNFKIAECPDEGKINDERIFSLAKELAAKGSTNTIYLFTNDKYFSLLDTGKYNNLKVIGSAEYDRIFRAESAYNAAMSQKFFMAVMKKDLDGAKNFAGKNIDVNFIDSRSGFTPLIKAIRNRDIKMVDYLLSLPQIDINAVDDKKYMIPPISHAIQIDNIQIVKKLIETGANVNEPSKNDKNPYNTPLMIASWDNRKSDKSDEEEKFDIVKLLVENGACINQQDKGNGFTALIKATFKNHPKIVEFLIEHGADTTICSFKGQTALDIAYEKNAGNRYIDIINLLQETK